MAEQLTREQFDKVLERVIATAPDGLSEAQFDALVDREAAKEEAALKPKPVATGGGRGTALNLQRSQSWLKENAPTIGATIAAMSAPATGGMSIPIAMGLAGAGAGAGSMARGDDVSTALGEAKKGALTEGAGRAIGIPLKLLARGTMKQAIPRNVLDEFDDVNVAKEALDRGAVMGSEASAKRIGGLSHVANQQLAHTAQTVPQVSAGVGIRELIPLLEEAQRAKMPDRVLALKKRAQEIFQEVGGAGLTGHGAYDRKSILQGQGKAATRLQDPGMAALTPQMLDAERAGYVAKLRETPGMEKALNDAQALMAVDRAGQATKNQGMVHRLRQGGAGSAAVSPYGLSMTAHAADKLGSPAIAPNVARLLMQLLGDRSNEQQ